MVHPDPNSGQFKTINLGLSGWHEAEVAAANGVSTPGKAETLQEAVETATANAYMSEQKIQAWTQKEMLLGIPNDWHWEPLVSIGRLKRQLCPPL